MVLGLEWLQKLVDSSSLEDEQKEEKLFINKD
jgi:hypothetical protein